MQLKYQVFQDWDKREKLYGFEEYITDDID